MPIKTQESSKWRLPQILNSLECMSEKQKVFKWSKLFNAYTNVVFNYPLLILISCLLLCTIVPMLVLMFYPVHLDNNPEKGFNTRNTDHSLARMAWSRLQPSILQGSRVVVELEKSESPVSNTNLNKTRSKRSWADEFLNSLSSLACYEEPIPAMDFMSQFIVEVPDLNAVFQKGFLTEMCQLQSKLRDNLASFDQLTPHRNIWHMANFAACLTPDQRINCTYLTSNDIKRAERLIRFCAAYRDEILECRRSCLEEIQKNQQEQRPLNFVKCPECDPRLVSANCSSQMMFDLFYRILPKNLDQKPFYLNTFLPIFTFSSYRLQGYDVSLNDYVKLEKRLETVNEKAKTFKIKGVLLDIKRDTLLTAAIEDARFSLLAVALIVALIIAYTGSLVYCISVLWQLTSSVLMPVAVYRCFTVEFPLLNLIVFVLLISIGSDGAFLLYSSFPSNKEELSKDTFRQCIRHTASTMFLTQFSYNCAIYCKHLLSGVGLQDVWPFCCTVIDHQLHSFDFISTRCSSTSTCTFSIRDRIDFLKSSIDDLIDHHLPAVLINGRFVWLCCLSLLVCCCGWLSATRLHLPQYNPLQLFVASNPNEFYDNNAERLFSFVENKIALPLTLRLVWGINGVDVSPHFDSREVVRLKADPKFHIRNVDELRLFAANLLRFRTLHFVQHDSKFWPERFLDWSIKLPCSAQEVCCNIENDHYSDTYLDYCLRVSTTQLLTSYNDTPIYHNITFEMIGYTALLPTKLRYSHRFANLSASINLFDTSLVAKSMWQTTEWGLMSTWYDLQRSIIHDSKQSVFLSLFVVLIFAASILRLHAICAMLSIVSIVICTCGTLVLFGWVIGMLEAIILVLIVGLSFDYTLHFGAAVPKNNNCAKHRIEEAVQRATRPVIMASASSFSAGLVLFASKTHAFFQVSVFLLISTWYSLLFATLFFIPLLYVFLPSNAEICTLCTSSNENGTTLHLQDVKQNAKI
ncbi:Protein dispatched [Aphelenchoides bicaudatus]|nr:Protein dispatched [Aphelenchoides bicaudatus]